MRLYKKAVALLLAAVLALSMVIVCSAAGSDVDAENSAAPVCPAPGTVTLAGKGAKKVLLDANSSKTAACQKKFKEAAEYRIAVQIKLYEGSNQLQTTEDLTVARKSDALYIKVDCRGGLDYQQEVVLPSHQEGYLVSPEERKLWDMGKESASAFYNSYQELMGIVQMPDKIYATTVKVGDTEYYAETYTSLYLTNATTTNCFTSDGQLKYVFIQRETGQFIEAAYQTAMGKGTSGTLCQRPEGYTVHTLDENKS